MQCECEFAENGNIRQICEQHAEYFRRAKLAAIEQTKEACAAAVLRKYGHSKSHGHLAMLADDVARAIRETL